MEICQEFEQEGRNILDYWNEYGFKKDLPLFYFFIDQSNKPVKSDASAFLITARALWAFSAGYEVYGDKKYLDAADRAFEGYKYFYDEKLDGYFRCINVEKKDKFSVDKKTYDQAFGIYGLAKYYSVTKNEKALETAFEIFNIIEEKAYDEEFGGYYDSFDEEWKYVPNKRHPKEAVKNMNCMLHVLEAYTLFYSVSKDERVLEALKKLTEVTLDKIFNKETNHLYMYFDRELNAVSDEITCGHDVETSWLLWETAEAIGDEKLKGKIKEICIKLVEASVKDGYDEKLGEMTDGCDRSFFWWWEQAEAVVGFYNMYQLTGNEKYIAFSEKVWEHIKEIFIAKNGEWYSTMKKGTGQVTNKDKIAPWKCPYHNFRMCSEMMRRLNKTV